MFCALALLAAGAIGAIETDPELKSGQELMEAFEYEKAAVVFDNVAKRPGLSGPDRAVALVWLGLAAAELRDTARASVVFEEAVTADPLISLPRDASPKIKTLLDDARARVRLKGTASKATTTPDPPQDPPPPPDQPPVGVPPGSGGGAGGSGILGPVAIGTLVVGGVVVVAGAAIWGFGLTLHQQAVAEPFQSRAFELNEQSKAAQIGGEVTMGVGAVALLAGGVLFFLE